MLNQSIKRTIMPLLIVNCTIYIVLLFTSGCKQTTEPPIVMPDDSVANTILLSVEWTDLYRIHLRWNKSKSDTIEPYLYRLTEIDEQGNKRTKEFTISGSDTSYTSGMVDSLISGGRYWFKVEAFNKENKLKDTSRTVESRTLSPTSHDIVWTIDTLGQPSDFLNDVWGLDENNVYAVGYVNLPGGGSGIIKWNGTQWNPFPASAGVKYGIFGFSESSIYVVGESSNRGFAGIWNGSGWTTFFSDYFYARGDTVYPLNAVWGSSPNDVWAVGDFGTIIHWDGIEWRKVELTQNLAGYNFTDIWGHGKSEVYVTGRIYQQKVILLKYNGYEWEVFFEQLSLSRFATTWGPHKNIQYLIEDLRNYKIENNEIQTFIIPGKTSSVEKIRGSGSNNIFTAGHFGEIFHYNGISWKKIEINNSVLEDFVLTGISVTKKEVFFVGYNPSIGGIFIHGKLINQN